MFKDAQAHHIEHRVSAALITRILIGTDADLHLTVIQFGQPFNSTAHVVLSENLTEESVDFVSVNERHPAVTLCTLLIHPLGGEVGNSFLVVIYVFILTCVT